MIDEEGEAFDEPVVDVESEEFNVRFFFVVGEGVGELM